MPERIVQEAEATEGGAPPAGEPLRVRRALVSVSDKTGVVDFARGLSEMGVDLLSTGGTASAIRDAGLEVTDVAEFTGQEEILGGRVKTLHPRLHAALLAKRDDPEHMATLAAEGIEPIDLVCVNLYPFQQTVARPDVTEAEAVENIDIGGPTMIRAAAKNHHSVAVVVRPESYDAVLAELDAGDGAISEETRHWLANEAFADIAGYDAAISRWFGLRYEAFPQRWIFDYEKFLDLSYGENPHQKAALYVETGARSHVLARLAKLHGRGLSFNNVLDLDSATKLLAEFDEPAAVIVKHNNPCGAAIADSVGEAYEKALACDPVSAFGGVIALNRPVDRALAERLHENFIEVLIAPEFEEGALDVLMQKEAIRILHNTEKRGAGAARARSEAGARRVAGADSGPARGGARADGGRHEGGAVGGAVARPAVRLEGVQARPLERDRVRPRRRDARDRRGADEQGGLGADRGREGGGGVRGRLRSAGRHGDRVGRVLPVRRRPAERARRRRDVGDPARRLEARRRGDRRGRTTAARRWSSPAGATSGTSWGWVTNLSNSERNVAHPPALPALVPPEGIEPSTRRVKTCRSSH